mgnify:CR=1 FL=1
MPAHDLATRIESFLPAELRRTRLALQHASARHSGKPVHEARKSIKKLRAVLRLACGMAPKKRIEGVAVPLREAAHALAPMREEAPPLQPDRVADGGSDRRRVRNKPIMNAGTGL